MDFAMRYLVFALSIALPALVAASPLNYPESHSAIRLYRRELSGDVADPGGLMRTVLSANAKIHRGFEAYLSNTGTSHDLDWNNIGRTGDAVVGDTRTASFNITAKQAGLTVSGNLLDQRRTLWYGSMGIGTPTRYFTVDFDTGSSDLFLPGASCASNCESHKRYDPGSSSASNSRGQRFRLVYGDGSQVQGMVYSETVSFGRLRAVNQAIGVASHYSSELAFSNFKPDGLMGMAFRDISQYHAPPVFQSFMNQKQTRESVFAMKLTPGGGELTMGGVNHALYTGDVTFTPVMVKGWWQVNLGGIEYNSRLITPSMSALVDSGTSLIIGPQEAVRHLYASIPGSKPSPSFGEGFYTVPCNNVPTLSINVANRLFTISPKSFNMGRESAGSDRCVGGIAAADFTYNFWIVGDVFLQNVYTVFDVGRTRVGFANLA